MKNKSWVDHLDDGYCKFHCNCGEETGMILVGEKNTCLKCGNVFTVNQSITIQESTTKRKEN